METVISVTNPETRELICVYRRPNSSPNIATKRVADHLFPEGRLFHQKSCPDGCATIFIYDTHTKSHLCTISIEPLLDIVD